MPSYILGRLARRAFLNRMSQGTHLSRLYSSRIISWDEQEGALTYGNGSWYQSGGMFGILKPLLKGENSEAGPKVRLLTHDRDRGGIPQVHGGVAPQAFVIFGLLFRCQVAISSGEAQADQQGGQEQAGDIHLRGPEWDREGSQVM